MNYIQEIKSFYNWLIENSLSGNAQALWHRLMAYCNAFGWRPEFTVANSRLVEDLSISRQELDRLRNILVQKERITYKKGSGNKAGIYTIIPFVSQYVTQDVTQHITQDVTQGITQDVTQSMHSCLPLNKLNNTKQNKTNKKESKRSFDDVIDRFSFSDEVKKEIGEYIKMRSMKNKLPTDHALFLVLNKLSSFKAEDRIEVLRTSIRNAWTDLYELKKDEKQSFTSVDKDYNFNGW